MYIYPRILPRVTEIEDVTLTDVANNDVLVYNSATDKWENGSIPSPAAPSLSELTDVEVDEVADNDVLAWDSDGWYNIPRNIFGSGDNYSEFEADGTLMAHGGATCWDDMRIVPGAFDFAGNADPTLQNWQPGGSGTTFKVYAFNNDDEVYFTCQVPHSWKTGTDMYAHVHWTPHDRATSETGTYVQWKLDYSVADINGVFGPSQTINMTDANDGTNHKHQMTPNGLIDMSGISGVSSMFVCRLWRDNEVVEGEPNWSGSGANAPFLLEFDIHYQVDMLGSRTVSTK